MPDRREDHTNQTDRPAGVEPPRDPADRARGDRARRRRARRARRCWSAATRSTRGCAGCTSPTAPASPACSTAASCCCRPARRGPSSPPTCDGSSASSPTPGSPGLVLELGTHYRYVPAVVVEAAAAGLALIVLHREVKFVTAHRGGAQPHHHRADRRAARPRRGARALHRARAARVARRLHRAPARADAGRAHRAREPRLRSRGGRGAARAGGGAVHRVGAALAFRAPARRAARQRGAAAVPTTGSIVPVEARGIRWGNLIALPGPEHAAGRAGGARAGRDRPRGRAPRRRRRRRVGAHRPPPPGRRAARGTLRGRRRRGRAARGGGPAAARCEAVRPRRVGCARRGWSERMPRPAPCAGARSPDRRRMASRRRRRRSCCRCPRTVFDDAAALWRSCAPSSSAADVERVIVSVGRAAPRASTPPSPRCTKPSTSRAADAAAPDAARTCDVPRTARWCSWWRRCATTTGVLEHGERMLSPLIAHDLARSGDLLDVLEAMLAHPGNRTAAAGASHLSRSVFYQRIALIEELLGADLDDGETQTALHLALLVRRSRGALTEAGARGTVADDVDLAERLADRPDRAHARREAHDRARPQLDRRERRIVERHRRRARQHDEHLVRLDVGRDAGRRAPRRRSCRSSSTKPVAGRSLDDLLGGQGLEREREGRGIRHRARGVRPVTSRTPARPRRASSAAGCACPCCGRRGPATSAWR